MSKIDYAKIGKLIDAILEPAPTTDGFDFKHTALEGLKQGVREALEEKFPASEASSTQARAYRWDGSSEPPLNCLVTAEFGGDKTYWEHRVDGSAPGWVLVTNPPRTPGVAWSVVRPYVTSVHSRD